MFCHCKKIDEDIMGEEDSVSQKEPETSQSGTGRIGLGSSMKSKIPRVQIGYPPGRQVFHKIACPPREKERLYGMTF